MVEAIQYAESRSNTTVTTDTYTSKVSLAFTPDATGDWLIIASADIGGSDAADQGFTRLQQTDGATTHAETVTDWDDPALGYNYSFHTAIVLNLDNTLHTFQIQVRDGGGTDIDIQNATIVAFPITGTVNSTVVESAEAITTTDYTGQLETLTWTATSGDHLVITACEINPNAINESVLVRTDVDTTNEYSVTQEGESTSEWKSYLNIAIKNFTAASHTVILEAANETSNQNDWRRRRVYAIHLDDLGPTGMDREYAEDLSYETQSTTTPTSKNNLIFTPSVTADYYMLSPMIAGGVATNGDGGRHDFLYSTGSSVVHENDHGISDTSDRFTSLGLVKLNLTNVSQTFRQRVWESDAGSSTDPGIGPKRIIGLTESPFSGTNINVPVGALVLTGQVPISQEAEVVQPGLGALSLTGFAPIQFEGRTLTPPKGDLTLTGLVPTITIFTAGVASPGAGSLVLNGRTPTLIINRITQPGIASLSLTGLAPTLHFTITVPKGDLVLTGFEPTAEFVIAVPKGDLVLTSFTPIRGLGIAVPKGDLTLLGFAPFLQESEIVKPGTGTLVLIGRTPIIKNPGSIPHGRRTFNVGGRRVTSNIGTG